jgi:hypothetical protein
VTFYVLLRESEKSHLFKNLTFLATCLTIQLSISTILLSNNSVIKVSWVKSGNLFVEKQFIVDSEQIIILNFGNQFVRDEKS